MKDKVCIGIASRVITQDKNKILYAPNLGSCLGVSVYDKANGLGGLVHCLLPLSKDNPLKAKKNPFMYVDTGVLVLIEEMLERGAKKDDLVIHVAGGANINDKNNFFMVGKKNFIVLRKFLWKNHLLIKDKDIGGSSFRTMSLFIETGKVKVKSKTEEIIFD